MRDQSHGRLNGSAAAAFATICERNRNTVSVLNSAGEIDGVLWGSGMRRILRIRQEPSSNYLQRVPRTRTALTKIFHR
jgi:hypothetical protein